jgi:hypothetical protein
MGWNYLEFEFLKPGKTMNATTFRRLLSKHIPHMIKHNLSLYCDNASSHKAKLITKYLANKGVERVEGISARSADGHPVEEGIHTVKVEVAKEEPTAETLVPAVKKVATTLKESAAFRKKINAHCDSLYSKWKEILERKGKPRSGGEPWPQESSSDDDLC